MNAKETKEFFLKVKWRNFKFKMKEKIARFIDFMKNMIVNSPEVFLAILGIVGSLIGGLFKIRAAGKRDKANKEEKRLKENYYYDKRRGHYVETRRKLNSRELRELDRRYKNGEDYSEILYSMKLMK